MLPAFADDSDLSTGGVEDTLKYTNFSDNPFAGQKQITDEEFQKTVDKIKAKQNKKKNKKNKNQFKGTGFNQDNSGQPIKEAAENILLLSLPIELQNSDNADIPVGIYKIVGKKDKDGSVYLDFYQAYTLVAHVPAQETNSDFNQPDINFIKIIPYNDKKIKVIYGSMDFNAYTYVRIKQNPQAQNY